MGCSTSRSNDEREEEVGPSRDEFLSMAASLEKLLKSKDPQDLLRAFIQLDKAIGVQEERNPSSVFGQAMSRQQILTGRLQAAAGQRSESEILSGESPTFELLEDIGLVRDPSAAAEHEEFLASINRRAMSQNAVEMLQRMLEGVEEQVRTSSGRISQLQSVYHQQDELLGQVFGEMYGSETEKQLEKDLDTMRYFRDMLAIGALQWELCADSSETAAGLLRGGVSSWKALRSQSMERKIASATAARNAFQEGLLLIETSQELLQDVQFPFCTARELKDVSQTMEYVFTDILIEERYARASEVYEKFLERAVSLQEWARGVLSSQLQKDLLEIEGKVSQAAARLRNERIYLICKKLRIDSPPDDVLDARPPTFHAPPLLSYPPAKPQPPLFDFPGLPAKLGHSADDSVQAYFQKIVESRKNTMWPSRRIDELQTLVVQD